MKRIVGCLLGALALTCSQNLAALDVQDVKLLAKIAEDEGAKSALFEFVTRFNETMGLSPQGAVTKDEAECSSDNDCPKHSKCRKGECECDDGYITPEDEDNGTKKCSYKQKEQMTALFLNLFLGLGGAGDFYVGRNVTGGIHLGVTAIAALGWYNGLEPGPCAIIPVVFGLATLFWWIVDDVAYSLNKYKDGNGEEINPL